MNLSKYRKRSGYGKRVHWSENAVAAKARLRIERAKTSVDPEPKWRHPKLAGLPFVTVTLECGPERRSFRVHRYDGKRLIALGKIQAASSIGRRVALTLDAIL